MSTSILFKEKKNIGALGHKKKKSFNLLKVSREVACRELMHNIKAKQKRKYWKVPTKLER